jgi:hypothetical protein
MAGKLGILRVDMNSLNNPDKYNEQNTNQRQGFENRIPARVEVKYHDCPDTPLVNPSDAGLPNRGCQTEN